MEEQKQMQKEAEGLVRQQEGEKVSKGQMDQEELQEDESLVKTC